MRHLFESNPAHSRLFTWYIMTTDTPPTRPNVIVTEKDVQTHGDNAGEVLYIAAQIARMKMPLRTWLDDFSRCARPSDGVWFCRRGSAHGTSKVYEYNIPTRSSNTLL